MVLLEHSTFVLGGIYRCWDLIKLVLSDCYHSINDVGLLRYLCREISDNLGHPVNCISMSNDGNCILASCLDSTLRLLDR